MNRADRIVNSAMIGCILLVLLWLLLLFTIDARLERAALACARNSPGTDSDIAACYTMRGLDCPDDICPRGAP